MERIEAFGLEITRRAEEKMRCEAMRTHTPQFARQRKKERSCRALMERGELPKEERERLSAVKSGDKGEPAKISQGPERGRDGTETKGDRERGSQGSQEERHRSARTKGIKGGDRESKAKSKGQYGPRPGGRRG